MNFVNKLVFSIVLLSFLWNVSIFCMNIFQAAETGNIGRIEELLASGAKANQRNNLGQTALHYAAYNGHTVIVQLLIDAGVDINQRDNFGFTALHFAAQNGHNAVVARLIEAGADTINQQDDDGKTAVDLATAFNQHTTVALLNDYMKRIEQARQRVPMIAHTLALTTHPRLGAASPLALLPQDVLHYITRLATQAEAMNARRPRQSSNSRSWCIIS